MRWIYIPAFLVTVLSAVLLAQFGLCSPRSGLHGAQAGAASPIQYASKPVGPEEYQEAQAYVEYLREANSPWLNRFGQALSWDVQYTFAVRDISTGAISERRFRTVYDRGLDFLPPSEYALYGGIVPNQVLQHETGRSRTIVCRWSSPRTIWQWPMASQYTVPSPLAHLHEFRRQQTQSVGALDLFFDPETGLLQRELFWGYAEQRGEPQWFPSAMFVYDYKGESTPQRIYAYAGKQDVLSELPTGAHECWQYTESLRRPEFKFQYSWYGSVVDGLYFITRMDVNAYGTDELIRTCEITDIVVSVHADNHDLMRDLLPGLSIYSQE